MAATSPSGRRSPADGERRLNSAIAPNPSQSASVTLIPAPAPAKPVPPLLVSLRRAYGSCGSVREGDELLEALGRRAGVERVACGLETFAQIGRTATGGDRPGRIEEDRRAAAAVPACEHLADVLRVPPRR